MGLDALGALVYIMQRKWCGHDKPSNRVGQGQVWLVLNHVATGPDVAGHEKSPW